MATDTVQSDSTRRFFSGLHFTDNQLSLGSFVIRVKFENEKYKVLRKENFKFSETLFVPFLSKTMTQPIPQQLNSPDLQKFKQFQIFWKWLSYFAMVLLIAGAITSGIGLATNEKLNNYRNQETLFSLFSISIASLGIIVTIINSSNDARNHLDSKIDTVRSNLDSKIDNLSNKIEIGNKETRDLIISAIRDTSSRVDDTNKRIDEFYKKSS